MAARKEGRGLAFECLFLSKKSSLRKKNDRSESSIFFRKVGETRPPRLESPRPGIFQLLIMLVSFQQKKLKLI